MTHDEFKDWLDSFMDHYNFLMKTSKRGIKIEYNSALLQEASNRYRQAVSIMSIDIPTGKKMLFFKEEQVLHHLADKDDWTDIMQAVIVEFMTFGAAKMIEAIEGMNS